MLLSIETMIGSKFVRAWGPVVLWMALIFFVSAQSRLPTLPGAAADKAVKKGGHLIEYAILAGLCWRALRLTTSRRRTAAIALLITVLYALSDEFHQLFVAGRNGTMTDVLVDTIGASLSLLLLEKWWAKRSGAVSTHQPAPDQATSSAGGRDPKTTDRA